MQWLVLTSLILSLVLTSTERVRPVYKVCGRLLKVSTASIERAKVILRSGDTDLIKSVAAGETSVAAGVEAAKKGKGKAKNQSQRQAQW